MKMDTILTSPISELQAKEFLESKELRDTFLTDYAFFETDDNRSLYIDWIEKSISKRENLMIEHIFYLSDFISYFSKDLLMKCHKVLSERYFYLTKLSCLDFLGSARNKVEKSEFKKLSEMACHRSKNYLVPRYP